MLRSLIPKIYWRTSIFNVSLVTILNFSNSYLFLDNTFVDDRYSAQDRMIASVIGLSYIVPSFCKGLVYGIMGPIGTYRIALGIIRSATTKDSKWMSPPFILGFSSGENDKYIMYPYGDATWIFPMKKKIHY